MEELVEDKVVRGAIQRWPNECWVRFLRGNNSNRDIDNVIDENCEDNTTGGGKEEEGGVPSIKDQANRNDGIGGECDSALEDAKGSRRRNEVGCGSAMPASGIVLPLSKIPIDSATMLFSPFSCSFASDVYK